MSKNVARAMSVPVPEERYTWPDELRELITDLIADGMFGTMSDYDKACTWAYRAYLLGKSNAN
jgi:hypothetical protein